MSVYKFMWETSFTFVFDGGGSTLLTGLKTYFRIPCDCTITRASLMANQIGNLVVDIWVDSFANFPPTVGDSITGGNKPTLNNANKFEDNTLAGWSLSLTEGDILAINIDSVDTITLTTLELQVILP